LQRAIDEISDVGLGLERLCENFQRLCCSRSRTVPISNGIDVGGKRNPST